MLLTADANYVYSNQRLYAISIETGEVSSYVDGAYGGGFINGNRYWYQSGENIYSYKTIDVISNVEDPLQVATDFRLVNAYPNPFNPVTTIVYRLNRTSEVNLSVFNLLGQHVTELVNKRQSAGEDKVRSGMYFYILRVDGGSQVMRGILLR